MTFEGIGSKKLQEWSKWLSVGSLDDVDESIESYFRTLDDHDREWSKTEETNARKLLDCMKILT